MQTVELLAAELSRSKKSIIGKLSREGVEEVYVSKTERNHHESGDRFEYR